jgi:hypothetical protein
MINISYKGLAIQLVCVDVWGEIRLRTWRWRMTLEKELLKKIEDNGLRDFNLYGT